MADKGGGAPCRAGTIKVLSVIGITGGAFAIASLPIPVSAAETPLDIRQAERNDPAAGEIVIINRKPKANAAAGKNKASSPKKSQAKAATSTRQAAPDPYAPQRPDQAGNAGPRKPAVSRKPETKSQYSTEAAPRATPKPMRDPAPALPPTVREQAAAPPPVTTAPLPARAPETADARRERTAPPTWRFDDSDAGDERPHWWADRSRGGVRHPPPGYRPRGHDWRYADRAPPRRWREEGDRSYRSRRPWRMCRRLAWRCRDGFERACWRWNRLCR